jgi:hypothetical protein
LTRAQWCARVRRSRKCDRDKLLRIRLDERARVCDIGARHFEARDVTGRLLTEQDQVRHIAIENTDVDAHVYVTMKFCSSAPGVGAHEGRLGACERLDLRLRPYSWDVWLSQLLRRMPALTTLDCAHFPHDRVATLGMRALPRLRRLALPFATVMLHDLAPFDTQLETLEARWISTDENPERRRLVSHRGMLAIRMLKLVHVRAGMSAGDAPLVLVCMPALASRDAIFVGSSTLDGELVDRRRYIGRPAPGRHSGGVGIHVSLKISFPCVRVRMCLCRRRRRHRRGCTKFSEEGLRRGRARSSR